MSVRFRQLLEHAVLLALPLVGCAGSSNAEDLKKWAVVWVARDYIPPLTFLEPTLVSTRAIPTAYAAPDALSADADVSVWMTRVRIPSGGQIASSELTLAKKRFSERIGLGARAAAIPADPGLVAHLGEGDQCAISVTFDRWDSKTRSIEKVSALPIKDFGIPVLDWFGPSTPEPSDSTARSPSGLVIVRLFPTEAEYVELFRNIGSVDIVLRADNDISDLGPGEYATYRKLFRSK